VSEYYYNEKVMPIAELKKQEAFKHISFRYGGPDDQWLTDNGVLKVESWSTIDHSSQVIESSVGSEVDGKWKAFNVRSRTNDEKWIMLRSKRDELLKDSDFTQLGDSPSNAVTWQAYRKLLRDLPTNYPNADDVIWPTPPVPE